MQTEASIITILSELSWRQETTVFTESSLQTDHKLNSSLCWITYNPLLSDEASRELPITISKGVYDNCYTADHQQKIDISVWKCSTVPSWLTSAHVRLRYRHMAFIDFLSSLNCCNMQHYACLQTSHNHSTAHRTQYRSSFLTLTWNNKEPLKNQCACKLFSQASPQRCANHLAGHPLSCSTA